MQSQNTEVTTLINDFIYHFWGVSPGKSKGAVYISCFVCNIFVKFGEGGRGRQVEGEPLVDRLCTGDVLNYTQHSGLLGCILDLVIQRLGEELVKGWKMWKATEIDKKNKHDMLLCCYYTSYSHNLLNNSWYSWLHHCLIKLHTKKKEKKTFLCRSVTLYIYFLLQLIYQCSCSIACRKISSHRRLQSSSRRKKMGNKKACHLFSNCSNMPRFAAQHTKLDKKLTSAFQHSTQFVFWLTWCVLYLFKLK